MGVSLPQTQEGALSHRGAGSPLSRTCPSCSASPVPCVPCCPHPGPSCCGPAPRGATHPARELSLVPLNPSLGCPHAQGGATACSALTPAAPWPPSVRPATCWVHQAPTPLPTSQGLFHHELHGTGFDSSAAARRVPTHNQVWPPSPGPGREEPVTGTSPPAGFLRVPPPPSAPPDGAWTQAEDPWRRGWGLGDHHSLDPAQVPVEGLPRPRHPGQGSRSQDPRWACKVVSGPLKLLERDGVLNLGERHSSEEPACRKQGQAQGI